MSATPRIVTRFAPSPTGYLHVGGARTALYNYLLARKYRGTFILRIEDTDLERSNTESIQAILDGLKWLGLSWDEGPYFQTQRLPLYQDAVDQLLAQGLAYPCFCTAQALEAKRQQAVDTKIKYRYDRTCHKLAPEDRQRHLKAGTPHVIRFYSTDEGDVLVNDLLKGQIRFACNEMDDLIIRRTDGSPTYNLSVVVDDVMMGITHVIRGDDHLNNTPRQIQLYEALGHPLPKFAHLPMILGPDKKRLSKRHGATNVMSYDAAGYLPQALLNYLVKLGWGHKDQEIFSLNEMVELFDIENCCASSAVFDFQKLDWLNGHYLREAQPADLAPRVQKFLEELGAQTVDRQKLLAAIAAGLEKAKTLKELARYIQLFFVETKTDPEVIEKNVTDETRPILKRVAIGLEGLQRFDRANVQALFEGIMRESELKLGQIAGPLRAVLSGQKVSPGVFDLILIFGKDECLKRLAPYR